MMKLFVLFGLVFNTAIADELNNETQVVNATTRESVAKKLPMTTVTRVSEANPEVVEVLHSQALIEKAQLEDIAVVHGEEANFVVYKGPQSSSELNRESSNDSWYYVYYPGYAWGYPSYSYYRSCNYFYGYRSYWQYSYRGYYYTYWRRF